VSSVKPSFLKSGLIYTFANIASSAVPFLLLPLLTRVLTPTEYSVIVNFSLLVTLFAAFAGLNVHGALSVIWFKQTRDEFPSYVFTAVVLAIASTAIMILLPIIMFDSANRNIWWMNHFTLGLAALTAGCNIIFQCRVVLWQCQQKPMLSAYAQVFFSLFNVSLSLLLVLVLFMGADGRNIAIAFSSFMAAIVAVLCFITFREINTVFSIKKAKTLLVFGLPLVLHVVAGVLLSAADRWIIAIKLDPYSLGIYGLELSWV
jgi:O-antigen/teichoic acid export membrane protein